MGAIFKNEDAYVLEWLAFHKIVGFSQFLIADNGSTDLTRQILSILQRHEPITLVDYPDQPDVRPQLGAYNLLTKMCPADIDAIAFVDADEFITPMEGTESVVPKLTELFSDPGVGGLALNWACFGSGGQRFWEEGLVIERFLRRSLVKFPVNQHYKAVIRPTNLDHWATPHHAVLKSGRYVDVLGNDLVCRDGRLDSLSKNVVWSNIRINHYVVKSFEEFVLRKSPKGSATKAGRIKHRKYFELHDKNNEQCDDMLAFVPAVNAEVERLEALIAPEMEAKAPGSAWRQWLHSLKAGLQRG
ncbi:glycosyltransferase family 2 protein [Bordetella tumbae]|uniref:glycosyltransferase family 2 protein n=1 Tax=Bordetella tumbae TaxID=1649139 RepID=UPI0039EEACC6